MSLSANQGRAEMEKKRLVWKVEEGSTEGAGARAGAVAGAVVSARAGAVDPAELVVKLGPMEIRTFVVTFL